MSANVWNDFLGGTDELNYEEIMLRLQEAYRAPAGRAGWGRPYYLTDYDGLEPNLHVQAQDPTESLFALMETYDSAVSYQGDNDGHTFAGPWSFEGDGTITGNLDMTGAFGLTGDFTEVGNADITGTLHVTGAVTFDATLHTIGAVTFDATLHTVGNVTFDANTILGNAAADTLTVNATSTFVAPATFQGNVTLGDAAADVITVTGTATVAEILTLTKGLIVDTNTFVVDAVNNRVGFLTATPIAAVEVASMMRISGAGAAPGSGAGLEIYYDTGGTGTTFNSYSRTGAAFQPVLWQSSTFIINAPAIRFYDSSAGATKQTVTGSRAGNAALASLLTGLAATGIITNSSSA